jgi:sugar fermentation stimulation protein A
LRKKKALATEPAAAPMRFPSPLVEGRLLRRYKRFLADVRLEGGEEITAHCANPGAMLGLLAPGARVFLSRSDNPARKLRYSWEVVEADLGLGPQYVGVSTALPNTLVGAALRGGFFHEFEGWPQVRREVKYGAASRVDFLLEGEGRPPVYVEVKNAHLMRQPGLAEFPDCATARGAKHMRELAEMVRTGARACVVFLIQMSADRFTLAADLDPLYARAFDEARRAGVEAIALACNVSPEAIEIARRVPLVQSRS